MKVLLVIVMLWFVNPAIALDWQESPKIGKLFSDAGVQGALVIFDVDADQFIGHDIHRAETRFIPASTFKIANSLIGLSIGAVSSVDAVLPYGGQSQPIKTWERDMSLREAIKISNVPIYQELARRIGLDRMRKQVADLDYGNGEIGDVIDNFWLHGPLQISAVEQTQFLARLAQDELPFPDEIQASVREIVKLEQGEGWTLYGKTGLSNNSKPGLGWWVGWVNKSGHLYCFALNIDILNADDAAKRLELGKASLKSLGIL